MRLVAGGTTREPRALWQRLVQAQHPAGISPTTISERRVASFFESVATPLPACMRARPSAALSRTEPTLAVAGVATVDRMTLSDTVRVV